MSEASDSGSDSPDDVAALEAFRQRFPVDDRAFDFLSKSPADVRSRVLEDFEPKTEGQGDYSALLTNFTKQVRDRFHHTQKKAANGSSRNTLAIVSRQESRACSKQRSTSNGAGRGRSARRRRKLRKQQSDRSSSSDGSASGGCESESSRSASASVPRSRDSRSASSSGSSSISGAEDREKAKAKQERSKLLAEAAEVEKGGSDAAEMEASRWRDELIARGEADAQAEMLAKLRAAQEHLLEEKRIRMEQVRSKAAKTKAESVKQAAADLSLVKEQRLKEIETIFEETLKKRLEGRERKRLAKQSAHQFKEGKAAKKKGKKKSRESKEDRRGHSRRKGRVKRRRTKRRRRKCARSKDRDSRSSSDRTDSRNERPKRRRSRSHGKNHRKDRSERHGSSEGVVKEADLDAFRDRYPMDSRAFNNFCSASAKVQSTIISRFKPKNEGERDYSALVMAFQRSLEPRFEGNYPRPVPRDSRLQEDRSPGKGGQRSDSPLSSFRDRYPMDDRAFGCLEQAAPNVRDVVIADFKPRREGENDYSALVMAFVRAVQG